MLPYFSPQIATNSELYRKVALGIDARSRESSLQVVLDWMESLRDAGISCKLLFVTAEKPVLIKRFSETRRRHPLTGSGKVLSDAIDKEQELLKPLHQQADQVIDTSNTNIHQLRHQVWKFVNQSSGGLTIVLQSFAFKAGVPQDVDFMFDARILPNPYWEAELRELTGKDEAVRSWLEQNKDVLRMTRDIKNFMNTWLPALRDTQRSYVTIGIGCTGGKHRSVYLVEKLAASLAKDNENVQVHHREIAS